MFGYRTPVKAKKNEMPMPTMSGNTGESARPAQGANELGKISNVRRSIGEWESGKTDPRAKALVSPVKAASVDPLKPKSRAEPLQDKAVVRRPSVEAAGSPPKQIKTKYADRLSEARACVTKAKLHLSNSRNLKTEIKTEVLLAVDRLFQLVKEADLAKGPSKLRTAAVEEIAPTTEKKEENSELLRRMEEHSKLIKENSEKMDQLKETLSRHSYASVAAAPPKSNLLEKTALHSVVVTGKDESESGEEVLNRLRKAVNAKDGGVFIEKIRKAKDRKVIVGCRTEEDRDKITERIRKSGEHLSVENIKNKNPLVILKDVLNYNTDEEILDALRRQNQSIFLGLEKDAMEMAYKKRTRNTLTSHIVLRVSPKIWQRLVDAGSVHIDLQRIRVTDQSPLVQCTRCLGYGHGKRFCKETLEKCSHCGGPHMRTQCADWLAGETASCCNCVHAKSDKVDHNAFSQDCPVRRRWETLAKATIAYC